MAEYRVVHKPHPQIDAAAKVSGQRKYISDLRLPGMLWGHVLRSTLSHARILKIDSERARRTPGVQAVVIVLFGLVVMTVTTARGPWAAFVFLVLVTAAGFLLNGLVGAAFFGAAFFVVAFLVLAGAFFFATFLTAFLTVFLTAFLATFFAAFLTTFFAAFFFFPPLTIFAQEISPALSMKYRKPDSFVMPTLATFFGFPPFLLPRAICAQEMSPSLSTKYR